MTEAVSEACETCRFYRKAYDGPHMKPHGTCRINAPRGSVSV